MHADQDCHSRPAPSNSIHVKPLRGTEILFQDPLRDYRSRDTRRIDPDQEDGGIARRLLSCCGYRGSDNTLP